MTGHLIPTPSFHPDMWRAVLEGRKVATARREKLGDPGDWWEKDGARYRIVDVQEAPFGTITSEFYRLEGFSSPTELEIFWIRIHRGHLPEPEDLRYIHFFTRIARGVVS